MGLVRVLVLGAGAILCWNRGNLNRDGVRAYILCWDRIGVRDRAIWQRVVWR